MFFNYAVRCEMETYKNARYISFPWMAHTALLVRFKWVTENLTEK